MSIADQINEIVDAVLNEQEVIIDHYGIPSDLALSLAVKTIADSRGVDAEGLKLWALNKGF